MPQPEEQQPSIFDDKASQLFSKRLREGVAKTRNVLHLVASMLFITDLLGVVMRISTFDLVRAMFILATDGALIVTLIVLSFYAKRKPFNAQLTALILYVVLQAAAMLLHVVFVEHSPLISLMVIGLLFSGLRRAQVVQRSLLFQQSDTLNAA